MTFCRLTTHVRDMMGHVGHTHQEQGHLFRTPIPTLAHPYDRQRMRALPFHYIPTESVLALRCGCAPLDVGG